MADALIESVRSLRDGIATKFGVRLTDEGAQRLAAAVAAKRVHPSSADSVLPALLDTDIDGVGELCKLERNVGSLATGAAEGPFIVQIMTVRDMTQPLRPCADMLDGEEVWSAANHKNSDTRLLRLTVTDGCVTVPAVELSTLQCFKRIPLPGEKLLFKRADVVAGMLMLTDAHVSCLGGNVPNLRSEALMPRGAKTGQGSTGAPRFEPFVPGTRYGRLTAPSDAAAGGHAAASFGAGGGDHRPAGGYRGGSDGGRGSHRGRGGGGGSDRGGGHGGGGRGQHGGGGRGRGDHGHRGGRHDHDGGRGGGHRGGGGRGHGGDRGRDHHAPHEASGARGGFAAPQPPPPARKNMTLESFNALFPSL